MNTAEQIKGFAIGDRSPVGVHWVNQQLFAFICWELTGWQYSSLLSWTIHGEQHAEHG